MLYLIDKDFKKKYPGGKIMLNMLWTAEYDPEWEENFKKIVNLKRAGFNIHNMSGQFFSEDEVIEALQGIDVFLVGYDPITEKVLKACPDLKVILTVRDGPEENIDLKACEKYGIPVMNSAGRCMHSVAELTWGLIMNMARPIITISTKIREEKWTKANKQALRNIVEARAYELYGKTLGIVGMGRNGQNIAKLASGFEMNMIGYDPYQTQENMDKINVKLVELDELMANSDYIVIMARVTPESTGMIGKNKIALMKPNAAIVNTARAQLVDYDALIDALKNDKITLKDDNRRNFPMLISDFEKVKNPLKLSCLFKDEDEYLILKKIAENGNVDCYKVSKTCMNFMPKGVNKYFAISAFAKIENIKEEDIVVIGDNDNDLEMLKNIKLSFTPKNAYEKAKEYASVTLNYTNDEDAFYHMVNDYLKI